jgi:hypothetical protein
VVAPDPEPPQDPDADLLKLEQELAGLLVEYEVLREAWPKPAKAMDRYRIGKEVGATLSRIGEIERAIAETQAETLAGAAVQLRRLQVVMDEMRQVPPVARALLGSALGVVESAARS